MIISGDNFQLELKRGWQLLLFSFLSYLGLGILAQSMATI